MPSSISWPALTQNLVEEAARLTRVTRDFGHAFLVGVELLERHHRQIDVVFLETEQTGGIVHQHVGVQHEELRAGLSAMQCALWREAARHRVVSIDAWSKARDSRKQRNRGANVIVFLQSPELPVRVPAP